MDKAIQIFCNQNKTIELSCGNKDCKTKYKLPTKDVFKNKNYPIECSKCGVVTNFDTKSFADSYKKQLKAMGVSW